MVADCSLNESAMGVPKASRAGYLLVESPEPARHQLRQRTLHCRSPRWRPSRFDIVSHNRTEDALGVGQWNCSNVTISTLQFSQHSNIMA